MGQLLVQFVSLRWPILQVEELCRNERPMFCFVPGAICQHFPKWNICQGGSGNGHILNNNLEHYNSCADITLCVALTIQMPIRQKYGTRVSSSLRMLLLLYWCLAINGELLIMKPSSIACALAMPIWLREIPQPSRVKTSWHGDNSLKLDYVLSMSVH